MKKRLGVVGVICLSFVTSCGGSDLGNSASLLSGEGMPPGDVCISFTQRRADQIKEVLDANNASVRYLTVDGWGGRCGEPFPETVTLARRAWFTRTEIFLEQTWPGGQRYVHLFAASRDQHFNIETSWLCNNG